MDAVLFEEERKKRRKKKNTKKKPKTTLSPPKSISFLKLSLVKTILDLL